MQQKLSLHPGWLGFAGLALAIPVGALFYTARAGRELPVLADLPAFSLLDEHGRSFRRDDLLGRVWIADFVFTACSDACPRLQQKMKRIQDRLVPLEQGGNIGLLSITVDPERDTPEKLRQYGQIFGAREGLWRYLTGPQQEVERTVVKGFHIAMAKMPTAGGAGFARDGRRPEAGALEEADTHAEAFDIMHGERLVLVDAKGRIRGYYDADEPDKLLRDARGLTGGGRG